MGPDGGPKRRDPIFSCVGVSVAYVSVSAEVRITVVDTRRFGSPHTEAISIQQNDPLRQEIKLPVHMACTCTAVPETALPLEDTL